MGAVARRRSVSAPLRDVAARSRRLDPKRFSSREPEGLGRADRRRSLRREARGGSAGRASAGGRASRRDSRRLRLSVSRAAGRRSAIAGGGVRAELSQSAGTCRRDSTRAREAVDGLCRLGFGFVEVGTLTPKPQAGNPEAAAVPAEGRSRRSSIAWASTTTAMRRPRRACAQARRRGDRRGQRRAEQGRARPHRRLCRLGVESFRRRRGLFHDQHFLAQHAGPAQSACARRIRGAGRRPCSPRATARRRGGRCS